MEGRRRTVVEVFFKNKSWYRRSRWSDPRIEIGGAHAIDAGHRRHPVGCILNETLPFRLGARVVLDALYSGGRSITRSAIPRRHAHG